MSHAMYIGSERGPWLENDPYNPGNSRFVMNLLYPHEPSSERALFMGRILHKLDEHELNQAIRTFMAMIPSHWIRNKTDFGNGIDAFTMYRHHMLEASMAQLEGGLNFLGANGSLPANFSIPSIDVSDILGDAGFVQAPEHEAYIAHALGLRSIMLLRDIRTVEAHRKFLISDAMWYPNKQSDAMVTQPRPDDPSVYRAFIELDPTILPNEFKLPSIVVGGAARNSAFPSQAGKVVESGYTAIRRMIEGLSDGAHIRQAKFLNIEQWLGSFIDYLVKRAEIIQGQRVKSANLGQNYMVSSGHIQAFKPVSQVWMIDFTWEYPNELTENMVPAEILDIYGHKANRTIANIVKIRENIWKGDMIMVPVGNVPERFMLAPQRWNTSYAVAVRNDKAEMADLINSSFNDKDRIREIIVRAGNVRFEDKGLIIYRSDEYSGWFFGFIKQRARPIE